MTSYDRPVLLDTLEYRSKEQSTHYYYYENSVEYIIVNNVVP